MNGVLEYLKCELDENITIEKFNAKNVVSLAILNSYKFYLVEILDIKCLLIEPTEELTIKKIQIHIGIIKEKVGCEIAVILNNASVYVIKNMINQKIAFIDTDNQMYLPFMALHLRKKSNEILINKSIDGKFSPTTQVVYLAILYLEKNTFDAVELEDRLKYNKMAISRATTDLKNKGLIKSEKKGKTGRKEIFEVIDKKEYYSKGKRYLLEHVKNTVYVKEIPSGLDVYKTGYTALSIKTMISSDNQEEYAIYSKNEADLLNVLVSKEQAIEENLPKIRVMKYDVGIIANDDCVDDVTLIYSLGELDERTEIAIKELMESSVWYME